MQRHKLRTAVLVGAAASLAAAVVPASASMKSPSPAQVVVVVDCFSHPQQRPSEFLIACGDGNNGLVKLRWSEWGPTSAAGSGFDVVNDCLPYCAAGKFHSYPVTVRLDRPEPWKSHPEQQRFTRLRLVYTDSRPAGVPQDVTYKLWD